jgi:hypothetical protein
VPATTFAAATRFLYSRDVLIFVHETRWLLGKSAMMRLSKGQCGGI